MAIVLPQAIAPAFVTSLFAISVQTGFAGGNLIWIFLFVLSTFYLSELRQYTKDLMHPIPSPKLAL